MRPPTWTITSMLNKWRFRLPSDLFSVIDTCLGEVV